MGRFAGPRWDLVSWGLASVGTLYTECGCLEVSRESGQSRFHGLGLILKPS